jgi:DNA recombination protein RmuC
MNGLLAGLVLVVGALVFWQILQRRLDRSKGEQLEKEMAELRRDVQLLAGQAQTFTQQMGHLNQQVTQQLAGVTKALQEGVTSSASITAQAQTAMAAELKNSRDALGQIHKQLGEVQQAGRDMAQATQTLESILGGAKTRGLLGELTLERLLEDCLPRANYSLQHRFSTGEAADAVIRFRDKLLAVDSKFPLDDFRRIAEEGDPARRAFAQAVRGHADAISKKYIVPNEGTLDIALMFVPSESVYYELLITQDGKGPLDEYCRARSVFAVSPNTLYAHLRVITMGLRGMQIEENAKRLYASLTGLQKQLSTFQDVFEKVGTHLKNAQQSYGDADRRLERTQNALHELAQGRSPDAAALPAGEQEDNAPE